MAETDGGTPIVVSAKLTKAHALAGRVAISAAGGENVVLNSTSGSFTFSTSVQLDSVFVDAEPVSDVVHDITAPLTSAMLEGVNTALIVGANSHQAAVHVCEPAAAAGLSRFVFGLLWEQLMEKRNTLEAADMEIEASLFFSALAVDDARVYDLAAGADAAPAVGSVIETIWDGPVAEGALMLGPITSITDVDELMEAAQATWQTLSSPVPVSAVSALPVADSRGSRQHTRYSQPSSVVADSDEVVEVDEVAVYDGAAGFAGAASSRLSARAFDDDSLGALTAASGAAGVSAAQTQRAASASDTSRSGSRTGSALRAAGSVLAQAGASRGTAGDAGDRGPVGAAGARTSGRRAGAPAEPAPPAPPPPLRVDPQRTSRIFRFVLEQHVGPRGAEAPPTHLRSVFLLVEARGLHLLRGKAGGSASASGGFSLPSGPARTKNGTGSAPGGCRSAASLQAAVRCLHAAQRLRDLDEEMAAEAPDTASGNELVAAAARGSSAAGSASRGGSGATPLPSRAAGLGSRQAEARSELAAAQEALVANAVNGDRESPLFPLEASPLTHLLKEALTGSYLTAALVSVDGSQSICPAARALKP